MIPIGTSRMCVVIDRCHIGDGGKLPAAKRDKSEGAGAFMNNNLRRFARPLLLVLLASTFAACHFHGHGCWSRCVPIRHCR